MDLRGREVGSLLACAFVPAGNQHWREHPTGGRSSRRRPPATPRRAPNSSQVGLSFTAAASFFVSCMHIGVRTPWGQKHEAAGRGATRQSFGGAALQFNQVVNKETIRASLVSAPRGAAVLHRAARPQAVGPPAAAGRLGRHQAPACQRAASLGNQELRKHESVEVESKLGGGTPDIWEKDCCLEWVRARCERGPTPPAVQARSRELDQPPALAAGAIVLGHQQRLDVGATLRRAEEGGGAGRRAGLRGTKQASVNDRSSISHNCKQLQVAASPRPRG